MSQQLALQESKTYSCIKDCNECSKDNTIACYVGKRWCFFCETLNYIIDKKCKYCGSDIIPDKETRDYFKKKEDELRRFIK